MKKIIFLLMSVVMIIAITAGCTQTTTTESTTEEASQTKDTSASTPSSNSSEPVEVPEIVLYMNNGTGTGAGSEAGSIEEDYKMVQDYILAETGVLVTAILPPAEGAEEKLSLLLAGGEQLDMWRGIWQDYCSSGIIRPINDLLDSSSAVFQEWDAWKAWPGMTDSSGQIWGIPRLSPMTPYPIFVRQDWLGMYHLSQPTTLDELSTVLYSFKENDPYGNGQTIPLITRGMKELEYCLVGGFVETGRGVWIDTDGLVKPLQMANGYSDFLVQLNEWYEDGIINQENFSWDKGTVREHVGKGDVGVTATWYSDVTLFESVLKENYPDASFDTYKPGLTGPNGNLIQTHTNTDPKGILMHANCENPEACMKFVNWAYDSWYNYNVTFEGIENIHWEYTDDPDAETNHLFQIINKEGDSSSGYVGDFCISLGLPMETKAILYDEDGNRNMHNLWLCEYLDDFDAALTPVDFGISFNTVEIDENVPSYGDITRLIEEETIKFVIGERPIYEFSDFIEELYSANLDDLIQEYTKQYNNLHN